MIALDRQIVRRFGLLLLGILLLSATAGRATMQPPVPAQLVTVGGTVTLPNGDPLIQYYVGLAPAKSNGDFDYSQAIYTITDFYGSFSFNVTGIGNYVIEVNPPVNDSSATPLRYPLTINSGTIFLSLPLQLPAAVKTLSGQVLLGGAPYGPVVLRAFSVDSWRSVSAISNGAGVYNFGLSGGEWRIVVETPTNTSPWMYTGEPKAVYFAEDATPESRSLNFDLTPTTATLTGRVLAPDGNPLTSVNPVNDDASVFVSGDTSYSGRRYYLRNDGTFSMPLVPGIYELRVILNPTRYPTYAGPPAAVVSVPGGSVNAGDLQLIERNATISGVVRAGTTPVSGVRVQAVGGEDEVVAATTDATGAYSLKVAPDTWDVNVSLDSNQPYLNYVEGSTVVLGPNQTKQVDLSLTPAADQVRGTLVDENNAPIGGLEGWAYARDPVSKKYISSADVSDSRFTLNIPSGGALIGVVLEPGSPYALLNEVSSNLQNGVIGDQMPAGIDAATRAPYEQLVVLPAAGPAPAALLERSFRLALNNAQVSGRLLGADGRPLVGVIGSVEATPAGANAVSLTAPIDPTSAGFSLPVAAGTWFLSYRLSEADARYSPTPRAPLTVQVGAGQRLAQDLPATTLDGVVSGTLLEEDGVTPITGQYVYLSGANYSTYTLTDSSGNFVFRVPLDVGTAPTTYVIGTELTCDDTLAGRCYLNNPPFTVSIPPQQPGTNLNGTITVPAGRLVGSRSTNNTTISGRIGGLSDPDRATATVENASGGSAGPRADVDADGDFFATLGYRSGSNLSVKVRAYYSNNQTGSTGSVPVRGLLQTDPGLQQTTTQAPPITLRTVPGVPDAVSEVFIAAEGWSYTFSDGSTIQIPANAVPLGQAAFATQGSDPETRVRVVVEPTIFLPSSQVYTVGYTFGFTISLYEVQSGAPISTPLLTPASITLRYNPDELRINGADEPRLRPALQEGEHWVQPEAYVTDMANNTVSFKATQMGTWALMQLRLNSCSTCQFLPMTGG